MNSISSEGTQSDVQDDDLNVPEIVEETFDILIFN